MNSLVFIAVSAGSLPRIVEAAPADGASVTLIVADGEGNRRVDAVTVIDVGVLRRGTVLTTLERSVIGRMLVRLSPWDGGARLRRRVRASAPARAVLEHADLVVAAERDGILTAWSAATSARAPRGLATLASGLLEMRRAVA